MPAVQRLIVGLLITLLLAAPSAADHLIKANKYLTLVVPTRSPVRFSGFQKDSLNIADFTGSFVLTGVYHVTYTASEGDSDGTVGTYFEPDRDLVARLPYWKPYKQHGSQITFDNPEVFLKAVLDKATEAELRRKNQSAITGRLAIKVNGYKTGVECDWPWFTVHFLAIESAPVRVATKLGNDIGC